MAQKTAFATDFDGTLYFHRDGGFGTQGPEGYRAEDVAAIRAYQEAGGLFGICTGRAIGMMDGQYFGLFEPDFVIALTGAYIFDGKGSKLWEKPSSTDALREVNDRYAPVARATILCPGSEYFLLHGDIDFPMARLSSMDKLTDPVYGMSIELRQGQEEQATRIAAEINAEYGDALSAFQNLASIDIVARGCSKGEGVRWVRREMGVGRMGGMGDSYNDLPLLEAADVAYTFSSAPPEVRAASDVIASGIAEALADLRAR